MRIINRYIPFFCLVSFVLLVFGGCQGDPNKDTILFDRKMAERQLELMRLELDHVREEAQAASTRSRELEKILSEANSEREVNRLQLDSVQAEIEQLESRVSILRKRFANITDINNETKRAKENLGYQVRELEARVSQLRDELEIILSSY